MGATDRGGGHWFDWVADLVLVAILTLVTAVFVFVPVLNTTPLRPVLSLAFVLFAPGYTVVSALFPGWETRRAGSSVLNPWGASEETERGVTLIERLVFSFGISVGLTILLGLGLGLQSGGLNRVTLYVGLATLTVAGLVVTAIRRASLPRDRQFQLPVGEAMGWVWASASNWRPTTTAVNVALAVTFVLAVVAVGASFAAQPDDGITEMYLLSENESGAYVPEGYPETVERNGDESFVLGISNQEGETVEYTIVVLLQKFEGENETGPPASETRLHTFTTTLEDGETERIPHTIGPSSADQNYRLTYLLYTGEPPSDPAIDNAHREVHLWFDVE